MLHKMQNQLIEIGIDQSENSSTQSFLSSFGSNLLAESELQFSIKNYINSDKFLDEIVQKSYLTHEDLEKMGGVYSRMWAVQTGQNV